MAKRIITAACGITLTLLAIFFSYSYPWILNLAVAGVGACCTYELCSSMELNKNYLFFAPCLVFTTLLPIIAYTYVWSLFWFIYSMIVFIGILKQYDKIVFKDIVTAYCMTLLISVSLGCIIMLRDYDQQNGILYFVLPMVLAWMADSGAFFMGKLFGKRKLAPNISPKKTVEGAVGGVIFAVAGVALCCYIFDAFILQPQVEVNYISAIIMAFVGAFFAETGDLVFSIVKRGCNVKDFGDVMPGHGGFLDRFDSIIFVAPYIYIFVRYFPLLS